MSFSAMINRAAGYIVKAATDWNVIVANFTALWPYDAAGKIAISTSATDLTAITFTRTLSIQLNAADTAIVAGDNAARIRIPASLDGWNLSAVGASRVSGTGVLTIQIRNVTTAADMLSTRITVDSGETDSSTAAAAAVIDTSNDGVATATQLAIDVDVAGTGSLGVVVTLEFTRP